MTYWFIALLLNNTKTISGLCYKHKENQLLAKWSKYNFGVTIVEYLGHIITSQGVTTDPSKVTVMKE
jgi:hypothetical protein